MMLQRELGISKKTLYQFVTDKDDLVGKFIDNEIEIRQEQICKCFKIGFNAIEELFEISIFMNKMMQDQNPATEHDLQKVLSASLSENCKSPQGGNVQLHSFKPQKRQRGRFIS